MIDISITYPFLIFKRTAKGTAPTAWSELTERQFVAISRIVHGAETDYRFLSVLTKIDASVLKKLSPYELLKLSEGVEFVGKAGNVHNAFIIRELQGTDFICPKPKLEAMTFGQFIFADAYYNDWIASSGEPMCSQNEKALNNLVATLYQLQGEKFDNATIADRVWTIANIDKDVREAIAFNYGLIMMWLQQSYPLVFQSSSEPVIANHEERSGKQSPREKPSSWLKLFDSLVGDDLINRERYAELSVHTVLRHLTNKYKENARKG
jgi:hypothetical protein